MDDPFIYSANSVRINDMFYGQTRLILFLLPFLGLHLHLMSGDRLHFHHLNMNDGLSQNSVYSIYQDQTGYMWFGTSDGLNRYDGYRVKVYTHNPDDPGSISRGWLVTMAEDPDGNLWIGSFGYGIAVYNPQTDRFVHHIHEPGNPDTVAGNTIFSICRGTNGEMWVGTDQGLSCYSREKGTFTTHRANPDDPGKLGDNLVRTCLMDQTNTLWIGTSKGLYRSTQETAGFQPVPLPGDVPGSTIITQLYLDKQQNLWICTYGGLYRRDAASGEIRGYYRPHVDRNSNYFLSVVEDDAGDIWFSVYGQGQEGIIQLKPESGEMIQYQKRLSEPSSLVDNQVLTLFKDRTGSIWVGTWSGGLSHFFSRNRFELYKHDETDPHSLSKNEVYSLCEDQRGHIWVSAFNGGLNDFNPQTGQFRRIAYDPSLRNGLSSNQIISLLHDQQETLWIGNRYGGLSRHNTRTGEFTHYLHDPDKPGSLSNDLVLSIFQDRAGQIWIGTGQGLNRWDPGKDGFTAFLSRPDDPRSLSHSLISAMLQTDDGKIWLATANGVCRMDENQRFTRFIHRTDNPITVSCMAQTKPGHLWLGTQHHGLISLDITDGTFRQHKPAQGSTNSQIMGILPLEQDLWISTNRGLMKMDGEKELLQFYEAGDGLEIMAFTRGCLKSRTGSLYFGSSAGLLTFNPSTFTPSRQTIGPVINSVTIYPSEITFRPIKDNQTIERTYRDTTISLDFSALDYRIPRGSRYAYRLEPTLSDWIDLGTRNEVTLTGLLPGEYRFFLHSSTIDGIWSAQETRLLIIITPPFWQTWWFKGIWMLLIILTALFWHRERMKKQEIRLRSEANADKFCEKYGITAREKEVIQLILQGKTNLDIENLLFISSGTVKNHIYNIFKKIRVKNRTQLASLLSDWKKEPPRP